MIFDKRIVDAANIIKTLARCTEEELHSFGILVEGGNTFTSYSLPEKSTIMVSARFFHNTIARGGGYDFGTHLGGEASISIVTKNNRVLVNIDTLTSKDILEVHSNYSTEEEYFQLSTIYPEDQVKRIMEYCHLRSLGYAAFLNWGDTEIFKTFSERVLECGYKHGHVQ